MELLHIPKTGGTAVKTHLVSGPEGNYWGHYRASMIPEERRSTLWSVIRNPYDRAISIALHAMRPPGARINPIKTAEDILQWWVDGNSPAINKNARLSLDSPMTEFLMDGDKVVVPLIVDYKELPRFFELHWGFELPRENRSARRRDYHWYYDEAPDLFQIVTTKFADDIVTFNYEY